MSNFIYEPVKLNDLNLTDKRELALYLIYPVISHLCLTDWLMAFHMHNEPSKQLVLPQFVRVKHEHHLPHTYLVLNTKKLDAKDYQIAFNAPHVTVMGAADTISNTNSYNVARIEYVNNKLNGNFNYYEPLHNLMPHLYAFILQADQLILDQKFFTLQQDKAYMHLAQNYQDLFDNLKQRDLRASAPFLKDLITKKLPKKYADQNIQFDFGSSVYSNKFRLTIKAHHRTLIMRFLIDQPINNLIKCQIINNADLHLHVLLMPQEFVKQQIKLFNLEQTQSMLSNSLMLSKVKQYKEPLVTSWKSLLSEKEVLKWI